MHATREPGGTKVAERIRALVLDRGEEHISATAETLLMFGARQVHVDNLIRPALARGEWVLCDRFTDATHAYQGGGRGVDRTLIDRLAQAVHGDLMPDCTLLLDVPVRVGLERMQARRGAVDRFEVESAQFFDRVRTRYLELARAAPARFRIIDATQQLEEVCRGRDRGARRRTRAANGMNASATGLVRRTAGARLRAAFAAGRLAHGLLIHEDPGAGGLDFARWIAQLVNCRDPQRAPCGECQECRWISADQHPDVTRLSPEEDSQYILIEQVRALIDELALTAHGRGYKVAILAPADALYPHAANSLLKTLEEPPPRTLLLLVTSQPSRLLPTVRSRCSRLRLVGPSPEEAVKYLEAARGAGPWAEAIAATGAGPFELLDADPAALAQLRNEIVNTLDDIGSGNIQPPAVAERWARGDLAMRLACLESWVTERILESASIRDATLLSGAGRAIEDMSPIRALGRHSRHAQAFPYIHQQDHGGRKPCCGAGRSSERAQS